MTRYEFAALLNGCLDRMTQLIAASGNTTVTTTDMATVNKLREEFQGELATLRGKVDALEYRTEALEANQFSTTAKLKGEAIFAVSDVFGGDDVNAGDRLRILFLPTAFAWVLQPASLVRTSCLFACKLVTLLKSMIKVPLAPR